MRRGIIRVGQDRDARAVALSRAEPGARAAPGEQPGDITLASGVAGDGAAGGAALVPVSATDGYRRRRRRKRSGNVSRRRDSRQQQTKRGRLNSRPRQGKQRRRRHKHRADVPARDREPVPRSEDRVTIMAAKLIMAAEYAPRFILHCIFICTRGRQSCTIHGATPPPVVLPEATIFVVPYTSLRCCGTQR